MKTLRRILVLLATPGLLAASLPAPLVTGDVRDQFGSPIAGARVSGGGRTTTTAADGTFALAALARRVRITCDYCRRTVAPVADDGTAVAIVQRFDAVATLAPAPEDVRDLPYGDAESILSLSPFAVLLDTKRALPGPRVAEGGLDRFGGLLIDDGIPAYDPAADVTAFRDIPAFDTASVDALSAAFAPAYGDRAVGGTFAVQTLHQTSFEALGGSARAFDAAFGNQRVFAQAASSQDALDSRSRADASAFFNAGGTVIAGSAFAAAGRYDGQEYGSVDGSIAGAHLRAAGTAPSHAYADIAIERSGYDAQAYGVEAWDGWSDASIDAGVESDRPVQTFFEAGARLSTGSYRTGAYGRPFVAGEIDQTHLTAGASAHDSGLSWSVRGGAFDAALNGGRNGSITPQRAQLLTWSASAAYDLSAQWNLSLSQTNAFRLPTLLEAYGYGAQPGTLFYDRYAVTQGALSFGDRRRLRAGVSAMRLNSAVLDTGRAWGAGAFAAWQIAPALSLRAWMLHFDDRTVPARPVYRYGAAPLPSTAGIAWLAYRNGAGITADLLVRRDLVDYEPDVHLDASVGGPAWGSLRWFAGSERHEGARSTSVGLRLIP